MGAGSRRWVEGEYVHRLSECVYRFYNMPYGGDTDRNNDNAGTKYKNEYSTNTCTRSPVGVAVAIAVECESCFANEDTFFC